MIALMKIAFLAIFFFTINANRQLNLNQKNSTRTKILHFNSVESPYHNPNATLEELAEISWEISMARVSSLMMTMSGTGGTQGRLETRPPLIVVPVDVGKPAVRQILAMDTGSSLLWVKCLRGMDPAAKYDPSKSDTFSGPVDCDSDLCNGTPGGRTCDKDDGGCRYYVSYLGLSDSSEGKLAFESFVFENPKAGGSRYGHEFAFGCSEYHKVISIYDGIFGLGSMPVSVPMQLATPVFSYCFGNFDDPKDTFSFLGIGEVVDTSGWQKVPLMSDGAHYYIDIVDISVAGHWLHIDKDKMRRSPDGKTGGTLVDSGSSRTILQDFAFQPFKAAIKAILDPNPKFELAEEFTKRSGTLCYMTWGGEIPNKMPDLQVKFLGQTTEDEEVSYTATIMVNDSRMLFAMRYRGVFCLNVISSESEEIRGFDRNLLGVDLQRNIHWVFDTEQASLAFKEKGSCGD